MDIIVPCYGYGHYLRECVDSVLSQDMRDLRVLIIDDASPDNTAEVARDLATKDRRVDLIRHSANKGHIATYNEGIEWACADYMLILSADDYLLPGSLSRAARVMDAHPSVGFTFGHAVELYDHSETYQPTNRRTRVQFRVFSGLEFIALSGVNNIVSTPTAVVRTELQKRLGGYRYALPHTGDMEMWLRFAAHASIGMLDADQAVHRLHSQNMALRYMNPVVCCYLPDIQQRKAALDTWFETTGYMLPDSDALRRRMAWLLGHSAASLASRAFNEGDLEASGQLRDYALAVCPGIRRSWRWVTLTAKQHLGPRKWRAMRPAIARVRRFKDALISCQNVRRPCVATPPLQRD